MTPKPQKNGQQNEPILMTIGIKQQRKHRKNNLKLILKNFGGTYF